MQYKLYLDLDCVLDTRLGIIATHFRDAYEKEILPDLDKYLERNNNLFEDSEYIKTNTFKALWDNRNPLSWRDSIQTSIFTLLFEIKYNLIQESALDDNLKLEIFVNIHRYEMTQEEQYQLGLVINKFMGFDDIVHVIQVPIERITPRYLKETYDFIVMYDFLAWSNIFVPPEHPESLFKYPITGKPFYTPEILTATRAEQELAKEAVISSDIKRDMIPYFLDWRAQASAQLLGYVEFVFFDLKYVSVIPEIGNKA